MSKMRKYYRVCLKTNQKKILMKFMISLVNLTYKLLKCIQKLIRKNQEF